MGILLFSTTQLCLCNHSSQHEHVSSPRLEKKEKELLNSSALLKDKSKVRAKFLSRIENEYANMVMDEEDPSHECTEYGTGKDCG